jgi:hypothetical protein
MDEPKKKARLTPEEQKEKERPMRAGSPVVRKGSGKISEEFWKLPKPEDSEGLALRYLIEDRRQGR